jgi:hypothetical protein
MSQINRSLKDKMFDRIDHALGRPVDPVSKTYRNFFSTDPNSEIGRMLEASGYWDLSYGLDGTVAGFCVNSFGREALKQHLSEVGDKHREYEIFLDDRKLGVNPSDEPMAVIAESASKAKAAAYREFSDIFSEVTFKEFMEAVQSVTLKVSDKHRGYTAPRL